MKLSGLFITLGLIICTLLTSCGGGGGGTGGTDGTVEITCIDVNEAEGAICDASPVAQAGGVTAGAYTPEADTVATAIFDSGDVKITEAATGIYTIENETASDFQGFIVVPIFIRGCPPAGFILGNRPVIHGGQTFSEEFGGAWCSNAVPGPNSYTVTVYTGYIDMSVFAPDWNNTAWTGDPENPWDWNIVDADMQVLGLEPLQRATVNYNYVP